MPKISKQWNEKKNHFAFNLFLPFLINRFRLDKDVAIGNIVYHLFESSVRRRTRSRWFSCWAGTILTENKCRTQSQTGGTGKKSQRKLLKMYHVHHKKWFTHSIDTVRCNEGSLIKKSSQVFPYICHARAALQSDEIKNASAINSNTFLQMGKNSWIFDHVEMGNFFLFAHKMRSSHFSWFCRAHAAHTHAPKTRSLIKP